MKVHLGECEQLAERLNPLDQKRPRPARFFGRDKQPRQVDAGIDLPPEVGNHDRCSVGCAHPFSALAADEEPSQRDREKEGQEDFERY
jgi:hypothetical protein